ncbi:hypothetical protein [Photobacterium leiognathi]|uniref:hypothetical protein n=1 Tax=Photobacterium leiognathi TaxID=553611 RepID=UPI000D15BB60|nr:hypothetical protein [Photobacterium leiognathi]PSW53050.1 hypothetical protein C0W50_19775 [Photobacterium leiognathi subsp. mandapamensis]
MDIEKWIVENSELVDNCFSGERLIHPDLLRELLKTHAIVPREPTKEIIYAGWNSQTYKLSEVATAYKSMINTAENTK